MWLHSSFLEHMKSQFLKCPVQDERLFDPATKKIKKYDEFGWVVHGASQFKSAPMSSNHWGTFDFATQFSLCRQKQAQFMSRNP